MLATSLMAPSRKLTFLILVLIFFLPLPFSARIFKPSDRKKQDSSSKGRGYAKGDRIPLFANKVYGADQRCDAFPYFSLPFCPPGEKVSKRRSLNEILAGDCLMNTQYELKFGVSEPEVFLCEKYLTEDDLRIFKFAIANEFVYQMYFDNIWFESKVGEVIEIPGLGQKLYLFNRIEFNVDFMEDKVLSISVVNSLDSSADITILTDPLVEFSYSVFWNEIKPIDNSSYFIPGDREKASWVLEDNRRLFWSSLWLWSILAFWWIILPLVVAAPYLFKYFLKNRQPHGNIHRFNGKACSCPKYTSLLGAILGVGTQHLMLIIAMLLVSEYDVAGFGSAIMIYICCIAPRNIYRPERNAATCHTRKLLLYNRSSPPAPTLWYMKTPAQMMLEGLGIFLPISPLMDDIYASLWGLKICSSFLTLFAAFLMVVLTTFISGMALTSVQLLKNDYNWWWRSILRGGSPAIYMFGYGIYFISKIRSENDRGFVLPLVYNCCICYSFFLVFGTVGFGASLVAFKFYMMGCDTKKRS
uniref:Transmembrane 9 superfamily member n=1 Tax=Cucumis melo TaxID=3656 RepID=A0A1S3CIT9_CUCME